MESVVYQDSPLAAYLEGAGEVDNDLNSMPHPVPPLSPSHDRLSFAPRGAPFSRLRRKLPDSLKLEVPPASDAVARLQRRCAHILQSKFVSTNHSDFLDRFHYILVASQLLNDHGCVQGYHPRPNLQNPTAARDAHNADKPSYTLLGVLATAFTAFVVAWSIRWGRTVAQAQTETWQIYLALSILAASIVVAYLFLRRQWVVYFRRQAIEAASSLVANAQAFDAASAATISLIQEVELVSRGYRISSPLPPISRLEDQTQTKRCARLRRALSASLTSFLVLYAESYESLKPFAVEVDLERYTDIYEVSRSDIDEVKTFTVDGTNEEDSSDAEALKSLKVSLQRLHTIRKLYLCCLLAIKSDVSRTAPRNLTRAVESMHQISTASASAASSLDSILSEESRFSTPHTPKVPLSPSQERIRAQIRKFASLSQGTRELQAKIYLLREESDHALHSSSDAADDDASVELGPKLLEQYDAFGADLKSLTQEWESGRTALAALLDQQQQQQHSRRHHRASSSSTATSNTTNSFPLPASSRSTTPSSLGGNGGTPADALKILNGEMLSPVSCSDEESVFEAVALPLPRARSSLSREERISKMREERLRQAAVREKVEQGRSMMRELETVIKFRPVDGGRADLGALLAKGGREGGRVTSL